MIFVATLTSYASPKLFSMNAMRFPSGDHEARSPKCVNCLMFGGSFSSGLPGFVPWGSHPVTMSASVSTSGMRMRRIGADLGSGVKLDHYRVLRSTRMHVLRGILAGLLVLWLASSVSAQTASSAAPAPPLAELSRSLQELAAKVSPSVVQIFVTGYPAPDEENQSTAAEPQLERSSGSGVIVDADGYIVTNTHVVENATRIEVELPPDPATAARGRSILKRRGRTVGAQVVAIDHETDIAVVKVEAHGLPALPFGDSDALRSGQLVLAFGSPLGLESSVSMGVVSAVARQLTPDDPMIYIQTDATINPGNSGGALVDTDGRLVGISTLIYSQSGGNEGIGFAAPSNIVRNVFMQIRKQGRVRRGEIGVNSQTITPLMAEALGLTFDAGVILADVLPGGPAEKVGLEPGDIVLSLDGKAMEN